MDKDKQQLDQAADKIDQYREYEAKHWSDERIVNELHIGAFYGGKVRHDVLVEAATRLAQYGNLQHWDEDTAEP